MNNEGFDITELRVGVLRRKHGYVMRNERNFGESVKRKNKNNEQPAAAALATANAEQAQDAFNTAQEALQHHVPAMLPTGDLPFQPPTEQHQAIPMETPLASRKRAQDLLEESEELFQSKKRRRRLRGHGPLPADAPGLPPRYKSETSLNECKAYLQLDNARYVALRNQFMEICNELKIVKKTKCEPGQWEASKDRLIRENLHLNAVMHIPHPNPNEVANALEVVCADVTKRIRVQCSTISIQDANNGLQINPAESKRIRHLFYDMLEKDGYTNKVEYGEERWEQLFQHWLTQSEVLIRLTQQGIDAHKLKYLKVLTRDAMKRLCDSRVREDPSNRHWVEGSYGPGPRAAPSRPPRQEKQPKQPKAPRKRATQDTPLDPALAMFAPAPPVPSPIPLPKDVEFFMAPESRLVGHHPKQWFGELLKCSVPALHKAGTLKTGAARVGKVFGIIKPALTGEEGSEDQYPIETDNDLVAYLHTAKELADEKLIFLIELSGGYA